MPQKNSYPTVTDQFCGAGGSSQGAQDAGAEVKLAMNHWQRAIDTHSANFQNTDHDCADISASDPRRYRSTDILITSPECTNHSVAKGRKALKKQMDMFASGVLDASAERSRATMWDVVRFAEYHSYNIIIVENVVDARKWIMFESWLDAMGKLGYLFKCTYLNSMHFHPTPQSRDRMYVVFWKKGNKAPDLEYMPIAACAKCEKDVNAVQTWKNKMLRFGKYKQQYIYCCPTCSSKVEPYYYAAFNCIDWSDPGKRIGDRKAPLSPNSEKRINYGLDKYGSDPFIFHAAYGDTARGVVRSVTDPAFTQTTLSSQSIIQHPFIINDQHSTGVDCRVRSVSDPINTLVAQPHFKLIMKPFIIKAEHAAQLNVKSADGVFQTQTCRQSMAVIAPPPLIVENKGTSLARESNKPLSCVTTVPYHGVITTEAWNSFIGYYYGGSNVTTKPNEPLGTVSTHDRSYLINYQKPNIEDCYYRMLKAPEIKLAMAFRKNYIVTGSQKDQVKQLGNAVTPPPMEWLVRQCIKSLN